jgi:hypothetical protein
MQTGRVVSVAMADFHDDQVVAFEFDHISLEFLGNHQSVRDLAWKESAPEVPHEPWRGLLAHEFHNIRRGHRTALALGKRSRSAPMPKKWSP